jgi:GntR family transcriptional repressor for pyruvate dehydrogenase complex
MDFKLEAATGATAAPVPREAAGRLERLIAEGRLRPGERLPSQRDLAERLGISRASLREALTALETRGLVSVQPGRGVFVARPSGPAWRFSDRFSPREVYEARCGLESFAAGLAADRMDEARLVELGGTVAALREAFGRRDIGAMAQADSAFHDLIIGACANLMLSAMYRSVREVLVESQRLPMLSFTRLESTVAEHEAILARLAARDPAGAADAMGAHIRAAASRLGIAV